MKLTVLEPPFARGGTWYTTARVDPVHLGPLLARSTVTGRWHRPRSGVQVTLPSKRQSHLAYRSWCGQTLFAHRSRFADTVPDGDELCGTCEGRAVGAGHVPIGIEPTELLVFRPASQYHQPPVCPAVKLRLVPHTEGWPRWVACPACGEQTKIRATGGPYYSTVTLQRHPPGPALIDPCPFHGWSCLRLPAGAGRAVSCYRVRGASR